MSYHRAPIPANMLSICWFTNDSTICFPPSHAMFTLTSFIGFISYPNFPFRTCTKIRTAFCVKLPLIYATVYNMKYFSKIITNFNGLHFFGAVSPSRRYATEMDQCSSCKNTYGGMVQLFTQTLRGIVITLIREWFTLKCYMGGWHPPSTRVLRWTPPATCIMLQRNLELIKIWIDSLLVTG